LTGGFFGSFGGSLLEDLATLITKVYQRFPINSAQVRRDKNLSPACCCTSASYQISFRAEAKRLEAFFRLPQMSNSASPPAELGVYLRLISATD
jgi:hypothetical protein